VIALLVSFLLLGLIAGCRYNSAPVLYENPELHVSLQRPGHWKVAYYERSGHIALGAKTEIGGKASARVEIYGSGGPCTAVTPRWDSVEEVQAHIQRIRVLYELDSVAILQPPTRLLNGDSEVVTALIGLPVAALPDDAVINQIGGHEPGVIQTIEIRSITHSSGCGATVYLYRGENKVLNAEAEGIVESIRFIGPVH
jgi:hypothetical protein